MPDPINLTALRTQIHNPQNNRAHMHFDKTTVLALLDTVEAAIEAFATLNAEDLLTPAEQRLIATLDRYTTE